MQTALVAILVVAAAGALACVTAAANYAQQVRHLELNGAHLIDTSQYNYGLTSPRLDVVGWKTISVNGDIATTYSGTCQVREQIYKELSGEQRSLISDTKNQINMIGSRGNFRGQRNGKRMSYSSARFSLFDGSASASSSHHSESSSSNKVTTSNHDGVESYSIGRPGMPNNLGRLFVDGDVVTFVYLDGRVMMKPINCLDAGEQQELAQSKLDLLDFKENMKNMQQKMQSNMQMMQQNMQQNMMNLQQSLQNNMFGGFGGAYHQPAYLSPAASFGYSMPATAGAYAYQSQYSPFAAIPSMAASSFTPGTGVGTGFGSFGSFGAANNRLVPPTTFGVSGFPSYASPYSTGSFF